MIVSKEIEVKITKQNIDYFANLNYIINLKDIIKIPIDHLQKNSHRIVDVKCDICGKETSLSYKLYIKNFNKYNLYTCLKCSNIKNKKTCLDKYGVEHQMLLNSTKEKIKKTCLDKYGDKNYNNREKNEKTCLEKYGSKSPLEFKNILNKIKNTNIEKYDNEYYFGSDNFKNKIKNIFINNFGVDNPSKSEKLQNKKLRKLYDDLNILNIDFKKRTYDIQCDVCNEKYIIPFGILHQRIKIYKTISCTICNPIGSFSSSGQEILLLNFIKENYKCEIISNSQKIINHHELDSYLPDLKLAFEFNGLYWHSELFKDKTYHLNKTELCEQQGIKLIHIYEDDWLFKQDIVKSRILNLLGKSNKIFARKCFIKEISNNELIREFLEQNHLQGVVGSQIKIGLFYNDELVSLMTFGPQRKSMGQKSIEDTYEMLRFCNKLNTNVVGGASRLFKYFVDHYNPKEVISYADRSWSNGNLYEKLGFQFIHKTVPNYYYVIDGIRKYRFGYRKDVLVKQGYDPTKTEHQIMLEKGIFRIYDSGHLKYLYQNGKK